MIGNGMRITKQDSGVGKIDPLIAMFNAVALMSIEPEAKNFDIDGYLEDVVIERFTRHGFFGPVSGGAIDWKNTIKKG
jgi:phage terminase large subunit-like protein